MESYTFPVQGRCNKLELFQQRDRHHNGQGIGGYRVSRRKLVVLSLERKKD